MNEACVVRLAAPVIGAVAARAAINVDVGQGIRDAEGSVGCFRGSGRMGGNTLGEC